MDKSERQRRPYKKSVQTLASQKNRRFSWKVLFLVVICSVAAALAMRFLDRLHYDSALSQANGQTISAQNQLGQEQHDLKFIIKNSSSPINCYQLQSSYDRNLCYNYNPTNSKP